MIKSEVNCTTVAIQNNVFLFPDPELGGVEKPAKTSQRPVPPPIVYFTLSRHLAGTGARYTCGFFCTTSKPLTAKTTPILRLTTSKKCSRHSPTL